MPEYSVYYLAIDPCDAIIDQSEPVDAVIFTVDRMGGWVGGWMHGWVDGWMNG